MRTNMLSFVFESLFFIFFLQLLQPGVTDQAFQVKWFFSEPFFRVFFWKGLVNYLILEAETALSVLYIRRLNASRAFIFNLCTRAPSEPMYLVYYSPFVIMLNSQTGHVNDTHVMSLKKPCLSETPASEGVVTARETGDDEDATCL